MGRYREREIDNRRDAARSVETRASGGDEMTSRERVLTAFEHRLPDRVPVDFSGHRSSGISAILYPELRKRLSLEERPTRVYDLIQQLAIVDEDVLDLLGIDTVELGRGFAHAPSDWVNWTLPNGMPCQVPAWRVPEREEGRWVVRSDSGRVIGQMPDGALYFDQSYFPLWEGPDGQSVKEALRESMWSVVEAPPGPVSDDELKAGAERLRAGTDRAVLGLFGGNLFEIGQMLFRNDGFLMLLADDPGKAHRFLDELTELHLRDLDRYLGLVGASIDIIVFGDDLGSQSGPQISPEMYCEFFKPRHLELWERAKRLAPVKVMLHCCGGVHGLLRHLIEAGLDAVNPVQTTARGMTPAALKAEFGSELVFWGGGCDTRSILPRGTPAEVRDHVREQVRLLSAGCGFVFQQVHNVLADVPVDNVLAMFEAVHSESEGKTGSLG